MVLRIVAVYAVVVVVVDVTSVVIPTASGALALAFAAVK